MDMLRTLLFAKIHRATVTGANINYVGSITVDSSLLDASGIAPYERVQVVDVDNGQRLETYVIPGPAESGVIELNGPAARLIQVGDKVIIMAYALVSEPLPEGWAPKVLLVDSQNRVGEVRRAEMPSDMCC
jgi:aspartate 1-decarboxylase